MAGANSGRAICVLGMHRSGTSCLVGTLQQAGVHLGEVSTQSRFNPRGNRESPRIMALHEALLRANGCAWDSPPPPGVELQWGDEHRGERDAIIAELSAASPWGFKDPRSLLALAGWREALPELETVGIFRGPLAVAASLHKRGGMAREAALALWNAYNRRLLAEWRARNIPILCFDGDEASFRAQAGALGRRLGLDLAVADFFAEDLRTNGAPGDQPLPAETAAIYSQLQAAAAGRAPAASEPLGGHLPDPAAPALMGQQQIIAQLKAKNDELRARIEVLKFKNDELRARAEKWKAKAARR